jgi:alkylated DNA repair dioxygenase AlkB
MAALAQPSLFAAALSPSPVQGLTYASEAITISDERDLAAFAGGLAFKPFEFRGFTGNRRTVSFGWCYDFNGGGFQAAAPMPDMVRELRARVAQFARIPAEDFVQCSIIEYAPGAGIGWHRDRAQFGAVLGVSLLAPCRLRFRRERREGGWERAALQLAPRSVYVLDGEARGLWQHSIPALDTLRYSVTFRTLSPLGASLVKQ